MLWWIVGPLLLIGLLLIIKQALVERSQDALADGSAKGGLPANNAMWLVLFVQNILGHLVTGPPSQWNEVVFNIYYILLFVITAVIVVHFQTARRVSLTNRYLSENIS